MLGPYSGLWLGELFLLARIEAAGPKGSEPIVMLKVAWLHSLMKGLCDALNRAHQTLFGGSPGPGLDFFALSFLMF